MKFPTEAEFIRFLTVERDRKCTSSNLANFRYISLFFKTKAFNKENVLLLKEQLLSEYKHSTVKKYIEVVKLVGLYLNTPFTRDLVIRVRGDATPKGEFIFDHEMKEISECVIPRSIKSRYDPDDINLRYQAVLTLMRFTGIPPVDLCNLTWVHDKGTHFDFKRSKNNKRMVIPIVPEVRALLDQLTRYKHGYIFGSEQGRLKEQTINYEIKRRCALLGIRKHVTSYSFRHSMITLCYIEGGEGMLPKLTKITGHDMGTAVKHYNHFNIDVLSDALYSTHPGLKKAQNIDSIKRILTNLIQKLIDTSIYEVTLNIKPKSPDERTIHLS